MAWKKCCCGRKTGKKREYFFPENEEITLDKLPVGSEASILKIRPEMRDRKKFADVGLVPGTELRMEARAPFGGLLRVKVLGTSMALHRDDAAEIVLKKA